ncbi:hypothetical protein [Rhodococcus qingshengii]|uniref:hypothetical protein n=1 Tax=Rhodococcus qingshengii TaxID=334542 RepID=UPI00237CAF53|nr:hypothetical protein [Rhodococcus qingshengii]WCT06040.1 hypothetical protein PI247_29935 [Rhodococcus qingshengii]
MTTAVVVIALTGLLILTRDLSISNDTFKGGVAEAETVDNTTDDALDGADQLQAADVAAQAGIPEVAGVAASLITANGTLAELGEKLEQLSAALTGADQSLTSIVTTGGAATDEVTEARSSASSIAQRLSGINGQADEIGSLLDTTFTLSQEIDAKLRIALLIPPQLSAAKPR